MDVELVLKNTYVFQFKSLEEKIQVFNIGPWNFNNSLITIKEPIGVGDFSKMSFNFTNFWVQFHNLPMVYMTKEVGWFPRCQIGEVVDIDVGATGDGLGKFLTVRIKLDISKPLEKVLKFAYVETSDLIPIFITYEQLPKFCYFCGIIGHS